MKKLGFLVAAAALFCAAPSAHAANLVADGSFEAGAGSGAWTEFSSNFGTPLCTVGLCGTGGGTGPNTGDWWAWFGGIAAAEQSVVSQPVVLPPEATTLTFWFENIVSGDPADFIELTVDGNQEWVYNAGGALDGILGYTQIVVDISAYADGGAHVFEFNSQSGANGTTNFFVDDVEINVVSGACCRDAGCDEDAIEASCDAAGGTYLGDDSTCFTDSGQVVDYVSNPGLPLDSLLPPAVDTIMVPVGFVIADLDVDFVVTHTWVGDLNVTLEGPDGTVVTLADNPCGNSSDDNIDVIFDDEGPGIVCGSPVTGSGPGVEALSAFDGKNAAGLWTITVTDEQALDTGTLDQWSLHFDIAESNCEGACCTDDPGVASSCIEATAVECEAENGLYVGGSCDQVDDCLPLFVEFESLAAVQTSQGVAIRWTTSMESDTAGFQVYAETTGRAKNGRDAKVMRPVGNTVHAAGVGTVGASYEVLDEGASRANGTVYWIKDIDLFGKETMHGPLQITGGRQRPSRAR